MSIYVQQTPQRVLSLNSWIKAGAMCGISALDVFDAAGVVVELESFRRTQASPQQLMRVLIGCTRASTRRHFPLVLGEVLAFDQEPMAETFLATCPTLREALKLLEWVKPGFIPWFDIRLHEHDDEAWLSFMQPCAGHGESPQRYVMEATMRAVVRIAYDLLGRPLGLLAVHFAHDKPAYHDEYLLHLGVEPRYQQPKNAIFFKKHLLDQALAGGRDVLHDHAYRSLMAQLPPQEERVSFAQQVVDRLVLRPEFLAERMEAVADSFGMSVRTLQRRLNKEGQGFTDVLNLAQKSLATQWLADTPHDIQIISSRLGYQSRRAFTSAFKQWTGVTPSEYRSRIRG